MIVLPVPPSVNAMYRNVARVGRVKSVTYNEWLAEADSCAVQQRKTLPKVTGPYKVEIVIPRTTKGDIDNRGKAVLDWLATRLITPDDQQCEDIRIKRGNIEDGFCHVLVEDFAEAA